MWRPFESLAGRCSILCSAAAFLTVVPALAYTRGGNPDVVSRAEVSFDLGVFEPRGDSDLWRQNSRFLTQDTSDFDDAIGGVSFASHVNPYLDFQVGAHVYEGSTGVRYRDFVDSFGNPIRQTHELRELPVDLSFKFLPIPRTEVRGRRGVEVMRTVVPYLGGGVGALLWDYREKGQFVDDLFDPTIAFFDNRRSRGITPSVHALAGFEVQINPDVALWLEGRYRWAKDQLGGDFGPDAEHFDFSGGSLSIGTSFRF